MAIRLTLECGHSSVLRERITPEGFTHDWEVFVRGVDNADIHQYVEKVVFQLHETFAKPKRVIKEPPYVVKESGYAGFLIPIHIYLKNKDEPKRFQILYKLSLQPRGRIINKVIRHNEIINNPSEEFRKKLLRGGGVIISSTESTSDKGEIKTPVMVGKPKLSLSEKKHRLIESKTANSFAELFGPPIKTVKISPESKKVTIQSDKGGTVKQTGVSEKIDKITKNKESPNKDQKKEKAEEKKDKKLRDPSKEKSRNKEKSKRPLSPGSKVYSTSPTGKRPSPGPAKRPRSPSPPTTTKRVLSPKSKEKDIKRSVQEKDREKEKEKDKEKEKEKEKDKEKDKDKSRDSSKGSLDVNKTEKKKDKKKYKDEGYKEKKEKYKETERSVIKEVQIVNDKKLEKTDKDKEKAQDYKSLKDGRKSPKPVKEGEKVKDEKLPKVEKLDKEKSEKVKENKSDKDRSKHKHKKKDKKEKRDSSKERERKEKREKSKSSEEKKKNLPASSNNNPLSMLFANMPERDSTDSAPSVDDDSSFVETKSAINIKKELNDTKVSLTIPIETARPPSPPAGLPVTEIKKEKGDRNKREKSKGGNRGEERENRKRKRRSGSKADDEHNPKREKDRSHSTSPLLEPVSSSQSPVVVEVDSIHATKDKDDRNVAEQTIKKEGETDGEQVAPDSTNCPLVESDAGETPPVFNQDYVSQLKDLQHKIMTLQDNNELQRVVQVIEETGQYEITKKTFDFDLCALDRQTVQRLQQFFSASRLSVTQNMTIN